MEYIRPKNKNKDRVHWEISERSRSIVKYYAEYTEYSESEIVDTFLINLLNDKNFIEWVNNKRNNKRIIKLLKV